MTSRQSHKRRGASFETDAMKELRERGYDVERLARAGANDEGDLRVYVAGRIVILEAKAPGQNGRIDLSGWMKEAKVEAENYAKARNMNPADIEYHVIIKARGKSIADAYAVTTLGELFPDLTKKETND